MLDSNGELPRAAHEDIAFPACFLHMIPAGSTRFRHYFAKLALAVVLPALILGLVEGFMRLAGIGLPTRFLVPVVVGNKKSWGNNPFYGYRFFAPEVARNSPPLAVDRAPATNVVRIVVLGESAAMGDPLVEFGAPRMLGKMLESTNAPIRFEVVNAAMTAINSPVVADIATELDRLRPDIVLIYMGNNEVVGPFGPAGSRFDSFAARLTPLRVAISRWRMALGLKLAIEAAARAGRKPRHFNMDDLGQVELRADDPRLQTVYDLFENRLTRIIARARNAGAEVLLCTLAVNHADCPPFGSRNRADWSNDASRNWQQNYAAGIQAQAEHRISEAIAAYEAATRIDAGHAELAYRFAQVLDLDGRAREARRWFARARDFDTRRFRADSRINRTIRNVARRQRVRLIDAERDFLEAKADETLFLDHVHFTLDGTYRIAGLWHDEIARTYPIGVKPSLAVCRERLFVTPWGLHRQAQVMAARFAQPPFSRQLDHEARQTRLIALTRKYAGEIAVTDAERLRAVYEREQARNSGDPALLAQWGAILLKSNRLGAALPPLTDYAARFPHCFEPRLMPTYVLAKLGRHARAAETLLGNGPPYGRYLFENAAGIMDSLAADGFMRDARALGQAILDQRRFFTGRPQLANFVAQLRPSEPGRAQTDE